MKYTVYVSWTVHGSYEIEAANPDDAAGQAVAAVNLPDEVESMSGFEVGHIYNHDTKEETTWEEINNV